MSAISVWVTAINGFMATLAAGTHLRASQRGRKATHVMVAVLAGLYAVGYGWLLWHRDRRLPWSEVMSGAGLLAWPLVWVWPAVHAIRVERKLTVAVAKLEAAAPNE